MTWRSTTCPVRRLRGGHGGWQRPRWQQPRWWRRRWPGRGRRWPSPNRRHWPSPPPPTTTCRSPPGRRPPRPSPWPTRASGPAARCGCGWPDRRVLHHRQHLQPQGSAAGKSCTVRQWFAPTSSGTVTATRPRPKEARSYRHRGAHRHGGLPGSGPRPPVPGELRSGTINVANPDGSSPRVLVSGQSGAEALAVDASHIYWTNTSNGTISEANTDGSNPHVIAVVTCRTGWQLTPATSTGPPSVRARSMRPTWTVPTPRPSLAARAARGGWRSMQPAVLDQPRRRHDLGSQPGRQQPARPSRAARQPGRGGGGRHPGPPPVLGQHRWRQQWHDQ